MKNHHKPVVENIKLPKEFIEHLHVTGKAKEIESSPNMLGLLVKEWKKWQKGSLNSS